MSPLFIVSLALLAGAMTPKLVCRRLRSLSDDRSMAEVPRGAIYIWQ